MFQRRFKKSGINVVHDLLDQPKHKCVYLQRYKENSCLSKTQVECTTFYC